MPDEDQDVREPTEDEEEEADFGLSDVRVLTVGLVRRGAIGEDFFLLKSDKEGTHMPNDVTVEEVVEETVKAQATEDAGLWDRIKTLVTGTVDERVEALAKAEPETVPEPEPEPEPVPAISPDIEKRLEALEKSLATAYQSQLETVEKAHRQEVDDLRAKIEKAEEVAKAEADKREQREFIEKAKEFRTLPVAYDELGGHLYNIAKAAPEDYQWLEGVLKAADKQLGAAGIFNEMGTSRTPEELTVEREIAKAVQEGLSPREALLSLSHDKQRQLLEGGA